MIEQLLNIDDYTGKKFDVVLMNPPYDKSLHLKFLEKTIEIADNVVSVQPCGWLTDTYADEKKSNYKKYENTILKHLYDIELYDWVDACIFFKIISHQGVGIFVCNNKGGYNYESLLSHNKCTKLINAIKKHESFEKYVETNKFNGVRVRTQAIKNAAPSSGTVITKRGSEDIRVKMSLMYNNFSCVTVDGYGIDDKHKWWSQYGNKNKYTKAEGEPIPNSIKFDTIKEAQNFENYCKTDFFLYCMYLSKIGVHTDFKHLPWMGNVKWSGKSGKIDGYKYPLTDEILFEYFNLSKEDIQIIKDTLSGKMH
jgi:hypothetical protein